MTKMYMMYVSIKTGANPNQDIEKVIDGMGWARLRGGDVYLITTDKSAKEIRDIVQPLLKEGGHILVMELKPENRSGFLASSTVDWLTKKVRS